MAKCNGGRLWLLAVVVLLLSSATAYAAKPSLVECDACVAVTTELCKASLKHNERLQEFSDRSKNAEPSKRAPSVLPMAEHIAATMKTLCEVQHMRYYTHPPPVLLPACTKFLKTHHDEVTEFFSTFHRNDLTCRAAVDTFCASTTRVCYTFDAKPVTQGGTETLEFFDPKAKREDPTRPRTYSPRSSSTGGGKKADVLDAMEDDADDDL